jgi:OOP family OmpA-OmpF porin
MRKYIASVLGSASMLVLASVAAKADGIPYTPSDGPYIGLGVGGAFPRAFSPRGGDADNASASIDNNVFGDVALGYGWGDGWRFELEGAYRNADMASVRYSDATHGGFTTWSLFGNAIYDIDTTQFGWDNYGFVPHVGVGLGWAHMHAAHAGYFNGNEINGEADALAYQGILGVGYQVAPDVKLDLDYRFVGTDTGRFETIPAAGRTSLSVQYYEVLLGLRWEFDHPEAAPAAYIPPPPPPPAPAPVARVPETARSFQVFFDFDKSNITDAAAKVIQSAAESVREGHLTRITVTGHTDTVGSAKYNQALSERRADAVKSQLVSDGIDTGEITTIGVGKTGLLVPTADGVREPQNRRAEIVLQ